MKTAFIVALIFAGSALPAAAEENNILEQMGQMNNMDHLQAMVQDDCSKAIKAGTFEKISDIEELTTGDDLDNQPFLRLLTIMWAKGAVDGPQVFSDKGIAELERTALGPDFKKALQGVLLEEAMLVRLKLATSCPNIVKP